MPLVRIRNGKNGFKKSREKDLYVFVVKQDNKTIEAIELKKDIREGQDKLILNAQLWRNHLVETYTGKQGIQIIERHCGKTRVLN